MEVVSISNNEQAALHQSEANLASAVFALFMAISGLTNTMVPSRSHSSFSCANFENPKSVSMA